ncbi:MAG: 3-dehydroquinate synthase [Gammaproteobacteria bacterium]|nr:3-dehydroquinate synthase [Gammaproteobacteria bacterium]
MTILSPKPYRLTVDLGERSYPIIIGSELLAQGEALRTAIAGRQVLVVTNTTVAPLYLHRLLQQLQGYTVATVTLADGEQYKEWQSLNTIFDALLEHHFNRDCTLIALGGGVVGDMTGFAAASYQRGVPFIQIPTTLLAQVDSSVGGKTGINHPLGKNMIGAFHQPRLVVADTATLNTLDDRQLAAGLAEVVKYGLINDPDFFLWLEQNIEPLLSRSPDHLAYAIERSCRDKAAIVAADEREGGQRALLNLGHTFGHAIETGMGYGSWLHGEAVATGMVLAGRYSHHLGKMAHSDLQRLEALTARAGLPLEPPATLSAERFMALMAVDKKVEQGRIRLVLLRGIGDAYIDGAVDEGALAAWLQETLPSPA